MSAALQLVKTDKGTSDKGTGAAAKSDRDFTKLTAARLEIKSRGGCSEQPPRPKSQTTASVIGQP